MYDALCSWENLLHAYRRASKGKRGSPTVAAFEHRLEEQLSALRDELTSGLHRPSGYTSFHIHEPKRRLISAAAFRDRVAHHALCLQIEPVFEPLFVSHSYANRIGKGTHRALAHAQRLARRHRYVLQCDLRQFFPSLDHEILRASLASRVTDARVMRLIDLILASSAGVLEDEYAMAFFEGDDLFATLRPRGLPIGNLTSQFWANVYMNPFDHFVVRELGCHGYVRYVDDMLLFSQDSALLQRWRRAIVERLARMRVTMHPGAHARPVSEGFPFLGFVVYPRRLRLNRRKGIHFRRRLRRLVSDHAIGRCSTQSVGDVVRGWVSYVGVGDTRGLRRAVLGEVCLQARRTRPLPQQGVAVAPEGVDQGLVDDSDRSLQCRTPGPDDDAAVHAPESRSARRCDQIVGARRSA